MIWDAATDGSSCWPPKNSALAVSVLILTPIGSRRHWKTSRKNDVEKLVEIRLGDALKVHDISRATVVTLYMLPEFNQKVRPILERELKPGARVVSHDFEVPAGNPIR
jgi:hypothetical protein